MVDAHLVAGGQFDAQIGQAQLLIGADLRPVAGIARIFRRTGLQPGVIAELAFLGDVVEDPQPLAGLHIEAAHIALGIVLDGWVVAGGVGGADDDHVARDGGGAVQADIGLHQVEILVVFQLQVDNAIDAEGGIGDAGLGIQREHPVADGDGDDAFVGPVGPVTDAAA